MKTLELRNQEVLKDKKKKRKQNKTLLESNKNSFLFKKCRNELINPLNFLK
ncbi:MAG: hypothetical protein ACUVQN_05645 [Caldisericia bacterium]